MYKLDYFSKIPVKLTSKLFKWRHILHLSVFFNRIFIFCKLQIISLKILPWSVWHPWLLTLGKKFSTLFYCKYRFHLILALDCIIHFKCIINLRRFWPRFIQTPNQNRLIWFWRLFQNSLTIHISSHGSLSIWIIKINVKNSNLLEFQFFHWLSYL